MGGPAPRVAELLAEAGTLPGEEARREAEILLCHVLAKPRSYLFAWPEAEVDAASAARFRAGLRARREGRPLAYLLGRREFWSLTLAVNEATLIPRADTELLVERALALELPRGARVVDLGTGSGAIALALARERPAWQVTGVDVSAAALAVARANGEALGLARVRWLCGSWFGPVPGERFDLVISNPPYVAPGDPHLARGDLRFEPRSALVADGDGFACLEAIIGAAPAHLVPGGWLAVEHGAAQGEGVRQRLTGAGFAAVTSYRDLAGHERATLGRRPDA
ncbi:MAG: peptide chain release factor N(5)-glutamine methyltransferase [Halieaceae bacterium]|jgi:release factor glutamine methyltransferase|nr:peptide chain release factor N(5)-glutamine methyltransferase [Halieaceae bacterium]